MKYRCGICGFSTDDPQGYLDHCNGHPRILNGAEQKTKRGIFSFLQKKTEVLNMVDNQVGAEENMFNERLNKIESQLAGLITAVNGIIGVNESKKVSVLPKGQPGIRLTIVAAEENVGEIISFTKEKGANLIDVCMNK